MTIEESKRMCLADKLAARQIVIDHLTKVKATALDTLDKTDGFSKPSAWERAAKVYTDASADLMRSRLGSGWVPFYDAAMKARI